MGARKQQVGTVGQRRVPEINGHEEIELLELIPVVQRVRHVHEIARLGDAADDGIRIPCVDLRVQRIGIGPILPPFQQGKLVDPRCFLQRLLVHDDAPAHGDVSAEVYLVGRQEPRRATAIARRRIPVAGNADQRVERTRVLNGIAAVLDGEHVTDTAIAVTGRRVDASRIGLRSLFDLIGGNMRYGGRFLRSVLGAPSFEKLPNRLYRVNSAVLQRDFVLARDRRIDRLLEPVLHAEARLIRNPALRNPGEQVLLASFGASHRRLHGPRLALPGARLGIVVRQAVLDRIPAHHAPLAAAFDQIRLFEQTGLRDECPCLEFRTHRAIAWLHVLAHEERRIRPLLHERFVVQPVLDDHVHPRQGQRGIGLRVERLPDVGFLAQVGLARIHRDERVGVHGRVHRHTAGIVVVRQFGGAAPANHDFGLINRRLPAESVGGLHKRGEVTRALAHLVRVNAVGAAE